MDPVIWLLLIIVGGKGGIGKTLLATLLTTTFIASGRPPLLVQADLQRRLDAHFPELTATIDINALENIDEDPLALVRAFALIPKTMRVCAEGNRDQVVDVAATWHKPIIRYAAEIGLAEKVAALGGKLVFLCPTTADSDSLALSVETAQMIEALVPVAQIVFVRNDYPAPVTFDAPDLIRRFGKTDLRRILGDHHHMALPAISPSIWGKFERAALSPVDVVNADPGDLISIAGADVDTVELMQHRVEKWLNEFIAQAETIAALRKA